MSTPEPLRNNPFRFRRRRSLHSKLYSEGRSDPIRPIDNFPSYRGTQRQVSPKGYMSGFPEQYAPHPGFMQIPQPDYQDNDGLMMENIPHLDHQRIIDEIRFTALELAGRRANEGSVKYDNCLMTEEFFQELIEPLREQDGELLPIPFDTNEIASHILAAQSQDEEIVMEQGLRENMIEIQMAVEQSRAGSLAELNPEPSDFGLAIPQDFFEQAEQTFEEFYEMQPAEIDYGAQMEADFDAQEAMFEQPIEEMGHIADLGPQTLENIVEAEQMQYEGAMPDDMSGMSASMDEGPVEQMYETPEQMEPYPTPPGYDDGMMPQEMYDEQMLYMMDPYMMPGPFGPMPFGPGPGPSGGP